MELPNLPPEPNFAAFAAIDWADRRGRRWRRACGRLSGPAGNATPRPPS